MALADYFHRLLAGLDATTVFYGLSVHPKRALGIHADPGTTPSHRSEILQRPQYARLRIGQIEGKKQQIKPMLAGDLSRVGPRSLCRHGHLAENDSACYRCRMASRRG